MDGDDGCLVGDGFLIFPEPPPLNVQYSVSSRFTIPLQHDTGKCGPFLHRTFISRGENAINRLLDSPPLITWGRKISFHVLKSISPEEGSEMLWCVPTDMSRVQIAHFAGLFFLPPLSISMHYLICQALSHFIFCFLGIDSKETHPWLPHREKKKRNKQDDSHQIHPHISILIFEMGISAFLLSLNDMIFLNVLVFFI